MQPVYDCRDRDVIVVGGGNTAMDAVRTARRLGARTATLVYRRSEAEMPARAEEVKHAREEGIEFRMLTNPIEFLGDEKGWLTGARCVRMELGEPDAERPPPPGRDQGLGVRSARATWPSSASAPPPIRSSRAPRPISNTNKRNYIVADPRDHAHLQARRLCRRRHRHRRSHGDSGHGRGPQGRRVDSRVPDQRRVVDQAAEKPGAEGDGGFNPRARPIESTRGLARRDAYREFGLTARLFPQPEKAISRAALTCVESEYAETTANDGHSFARRRWLCRLVPRLRHRQPGLHG